jgi:hypothetical protein
MKCKPANTASKVEKLIYDENAGLKLLAYIFNEEDSDFENNIRKGAAQLLKFRVSCFFKSNG